MNHLTSTTPPTKLFQRRRISLYYRRESLNIPLILLFTDPPESLHTPTIEIFGPEPLSITSIDSTSIQSSPSIYSPSISSSKYSPLFKYSTSPRQFKYLKRFISLPLLHSTQSIF